MKIAPHREVWVRKGTEQRIATLDFTDIKTIALIKHGALGDLVHTRPMILTLRRFFPNARITFSAISHYTAGIPEELVDRVHITKGRDRKYSEREKWRSMRELGHHDIIFDITQSTRSHWITLLNPATLKIGFRHQGMERFIYDIAINRAQFRFEAETFLEQLHTIGIDYPSPLDYGYAEIAPILEGDYLVYFTTASIDYKIWPKGHFAALINRAMKEYPHYQHVVLGGLAEWEQSWVSELLEGIEERDRLLFIEGGAQSEALLAHARCVVANDTGIRNLAISRGTPTLGIFMPSILFAYVPRFETHEIVYAIDHGAPEVEEVYDKLVKLLQRITP
jgi:ADP-heptose:LPS heptosyltransferase